MPLVLAGYVELLLDVVLVRERRAGVDVEGIGPPILTVKCCRALLDYRKVFLKEILKFIQKNVIGRVATNAGGALRTTCGTKRDRGSPAAHDKLL